MSSVDDFLVMHHYVHDKIAFSACRFGIISSCVIILTQLPKYLHSICISFNFFIYLGAWVYEFLNSFFSFKLFNFLSSDCCTVDIGYSWNSSLGFSGSQILDLLSFLADISPSSKLLSDIYVPPDGCVSFFSAGSTFPCSSYPASLLVGRWMQFDSSLYSLMTSRSFIFHYILIAVAGELVALIQLVSFLPLNLILVTIFTANKHFSFLLFIMLTILLPCLNALSFCIILYGSCCCMHCLLFLVE